MTMNVDVLRGCEKHAAFDTCVLLKVVVLGDISGSSCRGNVVLGGQAEMHPDCHGETSGHCRSLARRLSVAMCESQVTQETIFGSERLIVCGTFPAPKIAELIIE